MRPSEASAVLPFALCLGINTLFAQSQLPPSQPSPTQTSTFVLPAGTKVQLVLTRPIWALNAKAGDAFFAQVAFPATVGNRIAIPAGAFVQGTIDGITRPTRRSNHAEIDVLFTKIVYPNGYTVLLPDGTGTATASAAPAPALPDPSQTLIAITIQVSTANDLLLDNGAQVEMTLGAPLSLDAARVAQSIPLARASLQLQFKSATLCRFIPGSPGTPGTSDTVIPGSPGTPDTVIPGSAGMPDTVIPGTPATPDTVIPGTPGTSGTPDYYCPAAPLVTSSAPLVRSKPTQTPSPVAAK